VVGGAKGRLKKMMIDIPDELWAAYDSASDERIWNAHGEIGERYIRASLHEQQIQEWQEHHKAETDRLYERIAELEAEVESHDEEAQRWIRWNKMLIAEGKYKIGKLLYFIEEAVSAYPDLERLRSYPSLSDYYVGVGESYPGPKEE